MAVECVLPSNSFVATAEAVARCGAVPVFSDCDPATFPLDTYVALAAVTPRTRAVLRYTCTARRLRWSAPAHL
ncbi:DegT/DnrJ/EryC1/StrS family aminotransferase [Streptomyces lavendulae]|uniref:DegT/DnrJ/EryC1/StrS family aminotransferase n=1 Tax=Streptomyces lavendulae TaxID=1914 RepID=UPI003681793F